MRSIRISLVFEINRLGTLPVTILLEREDLLGGFVNMLDDLEEFFDGWIESEAE